MSQYSKYGIYFIFLLLGLKVVIAICMLAPMIAAVSLNFELA